MRDLSGLLLSLSWSFLTTPWLEPCAPAILKFPHFLKGMETSFSSRLFPSEAQLNCFSRCHTTRLVQPTETLLPFALQFGNLYSLCNRDYKLFDGGAVSVLSLYIGSLSQILDISSCSTRTGFFST